MRQPFENREILSTTFAMDSMCVFCCAQMCMCMRNIVFGP